MKQTLSLLAVLIATNLLFAFLIVPYAQQQENTHMPVKFLFEALTWTWAVVVLFIFISRFWGKPIPLVIMITYILSLAFWADKIRNLYCLGCAMG